MNIEFYGYWCDVFREFYKVKLVKNFLIEIKLKKYEI